MLSVTASAASGTLRAWFWARARTNAAVSLGGLPGGGF
jgi:hypothetical protein